ncbi:MAG: peptide deformylase [Hyphomicrobiaceae bacterium]|nr:peptide deformylase [Hyphomicrobiaceae bacterium]MCC0022678.1 peptide deformylase [Hyphomicrobiaceae bacterium]
MSLRPIVIIPDERLRTIVPPVESVTPEIVKQVKDMFDTMYDAPGIGLAAPQIGVMNRVIVVDAAERAAREEAEDEEIHGQVADRPEPEPVREPIAMINPEITWFSEETKVHEEGCLSIPEYYEDVERPAFVRVRYTDLEGKETEREAGGLLAVVIQHEVDHLNGKLFIDYLSRLKRDRINKRFQKLARRAG